MTKIYNYKNQKENGKHDTGRPTKYLPEYCQQIVDYFQNAPKTQKVIKSVSTGKNDFKKTEYEIIPSELPTITKFATKIGVYTHAIYDWSKEYPKFSHALEQAGKIYRDFLCDNALMKFYDSNFSKFVAINTTDMKDKTETDMNVKTFEHFSKEKKEFD